MSSNGHNCSDPLGREAVERSERLFGTMNFLPWVGDDFGRRKRAMLLFESQYDPSQGEHSDECLRGWNVRLLESYVRQKERIRFLTKTARLLEKEGTFWRGSEKATLHQFIYMNFIQFMIPRGKVADDQQVDFSTREFSRVLDVARPNIILSFGKRRVRNYLVEYAKIHDPVAAVDLQAGRPARFGSSHVINLDHPATQFSYETATKDPSTQLQGLKSP